MHYFLITYQVVFGKEQLDTLTVALESENKSYPQIKLKSQLKELYFKKNPEEERNIEILILVVNESAFEIFEKQDTRISLKQK